MPLKNPFPAYVVSRDGRDIQELWPWIQEILEQQGVGSLLEILKTLLDVLKAQIRSYALLRAFEEMLEKVAALLDKLIAALPERS